MESQDGSLQRPDGEGRERRAYENGEFELGRDLYISVLVVKGEVDISRMNEINDKVCHVARMNKQGIKSAYWEFPIFDNKGGAGFTHIQPIVESFIVTDWWHDFGHFYYVFASCKNYSTWDVRDVFEAEGFGIVEHKFFSVGIRPNNESVPKRMLRWFMRWLGVQRPNIFFTH